MSEWRTIVVGTRKSELALTQARAVVAMLEQVCERDRLPFRFRLEKMVTKGDRILDVTLSKVGGKGLFVKEIEQAMMDKHIDLAVHSMKDVPSQLQPGLMLAAVTEREDPRDCLVSADRLTLDQLPAGARIGTSSLRRACQLKAYRPDLEIGFVRGNIGTRIEKIETEGFAGVILAAAGLKRVGWEDRISELLPIEISLPAVGQGALGLECREDDTELIDLLARINDTDTARAVEAERSLLHELGGSCQVPIGGYAVLQGEHVQLTALVGNPDGTEIIRRTGTGTDPALLGRELARELMELGADRILEKAGVQRP